MVEYRFNSCGHRDPLECRSKAVGAYRIVMIGSSFSLGMYVSREDTFAALLPKELSHRTGRKTELYNESMQWGFPASAALRLDDVFAAKPDLILWLLTPADIQNASIVWSSSSDVTAVPDAVKRAGFLARAWYRLKMSFATNTDQTAFGAFWRNGVALFRASPVGILLQHILYASQSLYINSYLSGPDSEVGFLRTNPSVVWQKHLQDMEGVASRIEQRAAAAGVPLVAALLPTRAQAAMISSGQWPSDFDPYEIDEELRAIILKVGGTYIDILPRMQKIPNSEKYYFAVDTHPNARGHSLFAALLTDELTSGSVPVLEPRSFRPN